MKIKIDILRHTAHGTRNINYSCRFVARRQKKNETGCAQEQYFAFVSIITSFVRRNLFYCHIKINWNGEERTVLRFSIFLWLNFHIKKWIICLRAHTNKLQRKIFKFYCSQNLWNDQENHIFLIKIDNRRKRIQMYVHRFGNEDISFSCRPSIIWWLFLSEWKTMKIDCWLSKQSSKSTGENNRSFIVIIFYNRNSLSYAMLLRTSFTVFIVRCVCIVGQLNFPFRNGQNGNIVLCNWGGTHSRKTKRVSSAGGKASEKIFSSAKLNANQNQNAGKLSKTHAHRTHFTFSFGYAFIVAWATQIRLFTRQIHFHCNNWMFLFTHLCCIASHWFLFCWIHCFCFVEQQWSNVFIFSFCSCLFSVVKRRMENLNWFRRLRRAKKKRSTTTFKLFFICRWKKIMNELNWNVIEVNEIYAFFIFHHLHIKLRRKSVKLFRDFSCVWLWKELWTKKSRILTNKNKKKTLKIQLKLTNYFHDRNDRGLFFGDCNLIFEKEKWKRKNKNMKIKTQDRNKMRKKSVDNAKEKTGTERRKDRE